MTEKRASEIMERAVINGDIHPNTAEYMEALEVSIDKLGADYTRDQLKNWVLINKYPFICPRNVWTDKKLEDFDYTWTYLDDIPRGWKKAFGEMFCEELKEELTKYDFLNKYRVLQVKEKYGQFRWYDNGYPAGSEVVGIISKYAVLSENICAHCGKLDVPMTYSGWYVPLCKNCYCEISDYYKENHTQEEVNQVIEERKQEWEEWYKEDNKMRDNYTVHQWSRDEGDSETTYDISETANKIRKRYYDNIA